ncbi:hypothetical protein TL16_g12146 [Triparma laevis f. inornata]|uniref:SIAH-type domain-containing protein n=1 Tax=Triparma laevis f. inornata TaxID=1714386 RepID=A0A9W7BPM4_9STRA|nr:hypothetical protein TL16_g12146 [Triparma laevis f. inornata]
MRFPCVIKVHGCTQFLPWTAHETHLKTCAFRPFLCPNCGFSTSSWKKAANHVMIKHNDDQFVAQSGSEYRLDLTNTSTDSSADTSGYSSKVYIVYLATIVRCNV